LATGTIPRAGGAVKRPRVLARMPISCRIVFDVVRTLPSPEVSLRGLAAMCRLSPTQTRRALIRLHAAHLIRWTPGRPGKTSCVISRWRTFPQPGVSPAPYKDFPTPEKGFSHTGLRPQLTPRAHRWAMARLREEIRRYPVGWPRRNRLLAALSPPLLASITDGRVSTPRDLSRLVRRLIGLLRQAENITGSLKAAHAWANWAVAVALGERRG